MLKKRQSFFDRITEVVNADTGEADARATFASPGSMQKNAMKKIDPAFLSAEEEEINEEVDLPEEEDAEEELPEEVEEELEEVENAIGRLLVDMYEHDGNLVVQAMIAGVTPENLQVSITRDRLSIKGRRELPVKNTRTELSHHLNELYWGEFERIIDLPYEIDPENAEAVEKFGLLIVRLPRFDSD